MDYVKKFILGDLVKGQRIFNDEIIEGKFNGFHLHDKLDPTSVIGVICVENDRCYDVVAGSIELLGSEDEKIKRCISDAVRKYGVEFATGIITEEKMLVWLEKQGEQKPANNISPKFKVGDWITFYGSEPFKILKVESEQNGILDYLLSPTSGCITYYDKKYVDKNARLWTIKDAKDGDVLVFDDIIMIFKNIKTDCTANTYILYCDKIVAVDEWCDFGYNALPATKEQRDLLFQKMHEAGYEWDAEKKELWIKQKPIMNEAEHKSWNKSPILWDYSNFKHKDEFVSKVEELINIYGIDAALNTSDYLLAEYILNCLINFGNALILKDKYKK